MSSASSASENEMKPEDPKQSIEAIKDEEEYPSTLKGFIIMMALYLAIFLVTLDQNIITTAIPKITDEFKSINDVGWYGSAYLLTMCGFQLLMGKLYKYYPAKYLFLIGCAVFEIGSVVCGAAPSSIAFIIGRAIAGLGCSGLFSGVMVIMFHTIPLQLRPTYQGLFGAVFALASVVGPLIGGTFTDKVTWRWCFYINLPVGAVSMLVTIFIVHLRDQKLSPRASGWKGKVNQLDPIGNLAFFPGIICLILALQWGGTEYSWGNARIIVLLILFVILCLVFVGIQIWKKEEATIPPRIIKQRSILAALFFGFFLTAGMFTATYYLPIWFQAVKGVSAIKSGVMLLPLILATVFGTISSGITTSKVGQYAPFFLVSSILAPIGAGLLSTLDPSSGASKWVSYQILYGLGLGFGAQQGLNVVQTVLGRPDIATGSALVIFTRFLGSAIFLPVAQNLFLNKLISGLKNLPNVDAHAVIDSGALELRNLASGDDLRTLLSDYNAAIINVFYLITACSAVTILGSVFVEWRSMKSKAGGQKADLEKGSK